MGVCQKTWLDFAGTLRNEKVRLALGLADFPERYRSNLWCRGTGLNRPHADFQSIYSNTVRYLDHGREGFYSSQSTLKYLHVSQMGEYRGRDLAVIWISTAYPNVRYYEHSTRKMRNGQPDRYYTIRYYVDGKRKEEGIGWASEKWNPEKAYKVLSKIRDGIKLGEGPASLSGMRQEGEERRAREEADRQREALTMISLGDFLTAHFVPRIKREKRSWITDERRINRNIIPAIGALPLRSVTREDIQAFLDERAQTDSPATVKHFMAILRRAFNVAAATSVEGLPLFSGENPAVAKGLTLAAVKNERMRFLSYEEADTLIAAARKFHDKDVHDAIVLSLNTGLRRGELFRLEWVDVDLVHGFVTVKDEDKRKPGGSVPLNKDAEAIFKARLKRRKNGSPQVFPPAKGIGGIKDIGHQFKDVVDATDLNEGIALEDRQRRVVFHTLRHTFASWLALNGTDIYRIKTLMRHKTIAMTMRYAHLIPDATREAVHSLRPPQEKS